MVYSAFDAEVLQLPRPAPLEGKRKSKFWRQIAPGLDENGTLLTGGMWEPQRRWWNLQNFIKVFVGGYGSGKTIQLCKRAISSALQNAPCPVAIVSPSFPLARHTTILTLNTLLAGKQSIYGRRQFHFTYNKTHHEFRIRYKGRQALIIAYSGDDPLSLRGPNLASAYIDEPFIQELEVFTQMVARVRHPDAVKREIGLGGTPEQLNWGYDLCMGEMEDRHDVGVVQCSTRENLVLDPGYVQRLEGAFDDRAADAYIEGKFVNLGTGLVFYSFDPQENVVDLGVQPGAELGVGMDFNVNPMAAAVFWRNGNHMHYFDEIELENADTEYMCSVLRERHGLRLSDVYPDATGKARKTAAPEGKSDFWYLEDAGFTIHADDENPKRRDRFNAVNGKCKPRRGRVTLTVSPRCKRIIKYAQIWSHELMNKANQKAMSHLLDAFSYPIAYLFPATKEAVGMVRLRGV